MWRLAALGAVDAESDDHPLRVGEEVLADPRHGQVRDDFLVVAQALEIGVGEAREHEVVVGEHDALRVTGGAGRVHHDRGVGTASGCDLALEEGGVALCEFLARGAQAVAARELLARIVAQAARVVEPDVLQPRALGEDLEELVRLLLVLDDGERDLGVLEDVHHLLRHRVLVERNRDRAEGLGGRDGPVEARTVRADDRDMLAAAHARLREPAREPLHLVAHLAPRPRLPDAERLLADRRAIAARACMVQQQLRERVGRPGLHRHFLRPSS
jgi:hypothetical protein